MRARRRAGRARRGLALVVLVVVGLLAGVPAGSAVGATDGNAATGNVAPQATITQSATGASAPTALLDGTGYPGAINMGTDWTVTSPAQATVTLQWSAAQQLSSVAVVGSTRSSSSVARATLTFSDGSTLPLGAVINDPSRPTIIGFPPKSTTSLRFTITAVSGSGTLALAELRTYLSGRIPRRGPTGSSPPGFTGPTAGPCATTGPTSVLTVRCPTGDTPVGASTTLTASLPPGYTALAATVWPADPKAAAGPTSTLAPDGSGTVTTTLDTSALDPGPFTVDLVATGPGKAAQTVYLPLYRTGTRSTAILPSPTNAGRSTLVYDEEFSSPVAVSRTGAGADYAAAQPTSRGDPQDFGSGPFADPAAGLGTVGANDGLLRLGVRPGDGSAYPTSTLVESMLASARIGGSGFSAQYGYFEARIFQPIAPGTWPAFWMLPSDDLAARTSTIAEIDAVENYGVSPRGTCSSTHSYVNGSDSPTTNCNSTRFANDRVATGWHVYGVSVTPTQNVFMIDGRTVATLPQVAGGSAPMFFMVDLALGGGYPTDLSAVGNRAAAYVDWVRVYV